MWLGEVGNRMQFICDVVSGSGTRIVRDEVRGGVCTVHTEVGHIIPVRCRVNFHSFLPVSVMHAHSQSAL